mgnify:CR=1 FL=1
MATVETADTAVAEEGGVRRRDFINIAAVSFAGAGAVATVFPLVNQMNPSADVLALSSIEVDISAIETGQSIKTSWRKQPIFIRNLTAAEISQANAVDVDGFRDPPTLATPTTPAKENYLTPSASCTPPRRCPRGAGHRNTHTELGGTVRPCPGRVC